MDAMTVEERNSILLEIFRQIYSNIRSIHDFIDYFHVDIDEENYRKLTNGTAMYFENWKGGNQNYDGFMWYLKDRSFRLFGYRTKK